MFDVEIDAATPGRIVLAGELDLSAVACVEEAVEQALLDPRVSLVVLDLARVTFVDSSALGAIVRGHREAIRRSRRLVVTNATGHVRRVLDITGLTGTLVR